MREVSIDLSRANPKQMSFFMARSPYVGFGGARGGGKSWAVRAKAILLAMRYPGIRLLIVRRSFDELENNHARQLREALNGYAKYNDSRKIFTFPPVAGRSSTIQLGYCDAESDVLRYQGREYDCIFLDEATQLTEFQFNTFKACRRGPNDFPKRIYVTCNPGGVGHGWVKRLFIERRFEAGERPVDYSFIQADVYDNEVLMEMDPDYVRQLESLPYELRRAWLHGDWDVFAGQFFPEWSRNTHVIAPMEIPEHWTRYVTMDYGMDMLAAYLIAVDEQGRAYVLRELYEGRDLGEGHNGLIISEAAEALLEMAGDETVHTWLAPPDLWGSRQESGRSVADIFAERGIYLTKTSNNREAGWMAVREMLKTREDESGRMVPGLQVFGTCPNLIRTLPLLRYDERHVNDCANDPHEITHAPDALRGFCVYWQSKAAEIPPEPPREKLIVTLQKQQKGRRKRR